MHSVDGDYNNALMYYEKAYVIKKLIYGNDHLEIATTLNHMGNLHKYRGQYDMALMLHSEVLGLKTKLYGENHPSVQTTVEIIGKIQRIDEINREAEKLLTDYAKHRSTENKLGGIGFSKDAKVDAANFLLQHIKEHGLERFNSFSKTVGYYKHEGAIANGRLGKIVYKIREDAFTNFK